MKPPCEACFMDNCRACEGTKHTCACAAQGHRVLGDHIQSDYLLGRLK